MVVVAPEDLLLAAALRLSFLEDDSLLPDPWRVGGWGATPGRGDIRKLPEGDVWLLGSIESELLSNN